MGWGWGWEVAFGDVIALHHIAMLIRVFNHITQKHLLFFNEVDFLSFSKLCFRLHSNGGGEGSAGSETTWYGKLKRLFQNKLFTIKDKIDEPERERERHNDKVVGSKSNVKEKLHCVCCVCANMYIQFLYWASGIWNTHTRHGKQKTNDWLLFRRNRIDNIIYKSSVYLFREREKIKDGGGESNGD